MLIRVHSWFKSPHHQPLEKPQHKHTQPIKSHPPKNSCSFVSIRGSPPHHHPPKTPGTTTLNQSNSNPQKIRVHSWFKYPTPPPTENPRHNHTQRTKFHPPKNSCPFVSIRGSNTPTTTHPPKTPGTTTLNQSNSNPKKIRAHLCPFVVQIPPTTTHRQTPGTTTLNQSNSNPKKIRVHSWFKYPPAFLPLSTPPPLIFETRFRRLGLRRLQPRQFVCTALWYR